MGSSGAGSGGGGRSDAEIHGYLAEAHDLAQDTSALSATSGTLIVARLYVPKACTINNIVIVVSTAGATLTTNQNKAGLYTDDGATLLSSTADQATAWTTTGAKIMALGAGQAIAADTFVRVGILSVGTTPPQFRAGSGSFLANAGVATAAMRAATGATGLTALPASITIGSLAPTGTVWVGLT